MIQWLRRSFIAGFFVTVPLIVSVAALVWIFGVIDGFTGPMYTRLLGREVPGLGLLTTAVFVLLVGVLATNVIGKQLLQRAEGYLLRVPVFRTIYAPVKQLIVAFSPDNRVRVQAGRDGRRSGARLRDRLPDQGVHARSGPGSGSAPGRVRAHQPSVLGDVLIVPRERATFPDILVEEGIRVFLTGGMALPGRVRGRRGDDRVKNVRV